MYHAPLALQCIYGCSEEGGEDGDGEKGREWRLAGILYADDLGLCSESEKDLEAMVKRCVEMCRTRDLKINAGKSMVGVLNGEEGLEVRVDGMRLEHVSKFNLIN